MAKWSVEIEKLKKAADRRAQGEMARVLAAEWRGDRNRRMNATQVVDATRTEIYRILAKASESPSVPEAAEAQDAVAEFSCAAVREMLTSKSNIDNLLMKATTTRKAVDRNARELEDLEPSLAEEVKKRVVAKIYMSAKDAANLISDLSKRTLEYREAVAEFMSGNFNFFDTFDSPELFESFDDLSKLKGLPRQIAEKLLPRLRTWSKTKLAQFKKWFGRAGKFLMGVGVAVWVTTTVVEVIANSGEWSTILLKAVTTTAAGVALGTVISGTALAAAVQSAFSAFTAAGTLIEVPPVAAAFAAAGIVIAAGIAVVKLYDAMVNLLFGGMYERESMSVSLSRSLVVSLDSSLSRSLSDSLYPD